MEFAGSNEITITVVIPVRNEGRFIRGVLEDLRAQNYPLDQMEVLVVDGLSSDDTCLEAAAMATAFPNFRVLSNPGQLASRARNLGAKAAQGRYIVFIDGHCHLPSTTLISDIVVLFDRSGADALCRPQPLTLMPQTIFQRAVSLARASELGHALDSTIFTSRERFVSASSSGASYRREVFDQIGYYDESFDACEDVEFNTRVDKAGLRSYISPKLTVEYAARRNLAALFMQLYRYGVGRWQLFRKHPSTLDAGTFVTAIFTIGATLYPILWLISRRLALAASVMVLVYVLGLIIASFSITKKPAQRILVPLLPLIFFTIHFALGYGFVVGIVRPRS